MRSDGWRVGILTNGDPEELTLEVELDSAQTNDSIDLFLFGIQRSEAEDPPLIALQRPLRLTAASPISTATFLREDIALQLSDAPDNVRFEDGALTFAFRLRRGTLVTPLRVLDLDPDPDTIQDPLLDTTRPTVSALAGSTGTSEFRSDLRGLSLAGKASERVRSVSVETPLANNGALPVVGSDDAGFFLAAPVAVNVVAGGSTTFQFSARDEALNSTPVLAGTFFQFGVLGSSAWTPDTSRASGRVKLVDTTNTSRLPARTPTAPMPRIQRLRSSRNVVVSSSDFSTVSVTCRAEPCRS